MYEWEAKFSVPILGIKYPLACPNGIIIFDKIYAADEELALFMASCDLSELLMDVGIHESEIEAPELLGIYTVSTLW